MKFITITGIVASVANVFVHYNNDPAFWGWVAATAWASCLLLREYTTNK